MLSIPTTLLLLAPTILAHGIITSPPARPAGPALTSACGAKIALATQQDNTSFIEQLVKLAPTSPDYNPQACNLFLCKGLQFPDNKAGVQTWTAGQEVPINISMRIPHLGSANVSLVDTRTNEIIGKDGVDGGLLKDWPSGYSPGSKESDIPIGQREFSVVVPEGLEERCKTAGDCVLQWWWLYDARPVVIETFESCVDFVIAPKNATQTYKARSFKA